MDLINALDRNKSMIGAKAIKGGICNEYLSGDRRKKLGEGHTLHGL